MGRLIIALALTLSLGLSLAGCKEESGPPPQADMGQRSPEVEKEMQKYDKEAAAPADSPVKHGKDVEAVANP